MGLDAKHLALSSAGCMYPFPTSSISKRPGWTIVQSEGWNFTALEANATSLLLLLVLRMGKKEKMKNKKGRRRKRRKEEKRENRGQREKEKKRQNVQREKGFLHCSKNHSMGT
jgi:hypothetical protein